MSECELCECLDFTCECFPESKEKYSILKANLEQAESDLAKCREESERLKRIILDGNVTEYLEENKRLKAKAEGKKA